MKKLIFVDTCVMKGILKELLIIIKKYPAMINHKDYNPASYGHVITAVCFSIQAVGVGIYISYGVFFNSLMDEFDWSRAAIAGASAAALFVMGFFGILIGRLNDTFGPRILMSIASVFFGFGFCLVSQADTVLKLYLFFGLIFGMGLSTVDVIALTTIARWYARNRGRMTGLVKVGTGAGQFIFPILASFMISWFGWKNAFIYIGVFGFLSFFILAQFLRRDPGVNSDTGTSDKLTVSQDHGLSFSQAVKTPEMWLICIVNMLVVSCLMSVLIHIIPHARDIGISPHRAAGILSAIGAISMAGRFVSGIAIDRTGSKMIMGICFGFLIVSLLWLIRADALWKLYLFACIYGIAHGGFFTAISLIMVELFGIRAHGSLFGTVVFFGTAGGAAGPVLHGWLFDMTQSYTYSFWLMLCISFVGFCLLLCLKVKET
jgi:MFS family permease